MATYGFGFLQKLAQAPMMAKVMVATVPAVTVTVTADFLKQASEALQIECKSPEELNELFDQIDTDHSGYLDRDEIHAALKSRGLQMGGSIANALISHVDQNHDGLIDRKEFSQLAIGFSLQTKAQSVFKMKGMTEPELKQLFRQMDTDNSGYLDAAEIQAAFLKRDVHVGMSMANALISTVDYNHDGLMSEEEFLMLARQK